MLIPIRCFSCGKPIAHLKQEYDERTTKGEDKKKVLDSLGLHRYCCRSVMISTVELIDDAARFKTF